jgi:hypothetical protein
LTWTFRAWRYTKWRDRDGPGHFRAHILRRNWTRELDYKLQKTLWGFRDHRMAVEFQYEWRDNIGNWSRSYGVELWEFAGSGLMKRREASINDLQIAASERRISVPAEI